jgi:hypothetical protein
MKYLVIISIFYCLSSCSFSQTSKDVNKLSGNPVSDLQMLLKKGVHTANIMDSVVQTPEQLRIIMKFQKSVQANYTWYIDFLKKIPEGQPLPYDERLGITKEEYNVILTMNDHTIIVSSAKENLTITSEGNFIHFKGTGRLVVFDSIKINIKNNYIQFLKYQIPFIDTVRINNDKNGLKSKWFGYSYKLEEPKKLTPDDLKDLKNLQYKQFKLTVAQLESTGKTYLDFSATVIENGMKTVEIRVPIILE